MSSNDPWNHELSAVQTAFTHRGAVEPGLDVHGNTEALIQLRKACRILDGIRALREIDRHYTLVVEGSFAALERTIQFYVIHQNVADADEMHSHDDTFDYAADAGLFADSTKADLIDLWKPNRNSSSYQQPRATDKQATAMLNYAECMHDHIPQLAGRAHDCIC